MNRIETLSKKLEDLKRRKQKIKISLSMHLYSEIEKILKEDFSPELALTLIQESWCHSHKTREEWLNLSASFRKPQSSHTRSAIETM